MVVTKIISAVIPAYSEISVVKNSVISLATQWIPDDSFKIEIVIVNDNPKRDYSYFQSKEFDIIKNKNVEVVIINNEKNYGQGISRQIGIDNAKSNWFVLCDEDDMYAPNALYRFWEILNEQHCNGEVGKPVALLAAPVYSFDRNKSRMIIQSNAIWVNGKLYNRQFLRDNNIFFMNDVTSYHAEDYPFVEKLNYAIEMSKTYKRVDFTDDADTFYYWMPNDKSISRCEKFYTAQITPYTMLASMHLYDYIKKYNEVNNIEREQDEFMKHKILNMCAYSYHAYSRWMYDMACGWSKSEICLESEWELLKSSLNRIREEIKVYWKEYCPSDIYDVMHNIKHHSDVRFIEPFICPFKEWVEKGYKTDKMNFEEIKKYCEGLEFDGYPHEVGTDYVKAWCKRHEMKLP